MSSMVVKFNISARELKKNREEILAERFRFIDLWVDYIKNTPDKIWSRQQKKLIDAQMKR